MLRFKVHAAILMLVLSAAGAQAAQVVALGASNTHGKGQGRTNDGVPRGQAFPAQLERMLNAQGCRVRVANAGIAGDTTGGMLRRMNRAIGRDTKVVILQPGGNDARRGEGGDRAGNISQIRSQLSARGIRVIVLEQLGRIAGSQNRLPDGQHFNAQGHAQIAAYLAPMVRSAGACG